MLRKPDRLHAMIQASPLNPRGERRTRRDLWRYTLPRGENMDFMNRLNDAMDYVEDNLCEELDPNAISRRMGCSYGLFLRAFAQIAGVPLGEYMRRRRLTCAAYELRHSDQRVLDIAVKYGYDSADAFTVAFKRMHGVSPQAARQQDTALKFYGRLHFTLSIKGEQEMDYRLIHKEPFRVAGVRRTTAQAGGAWSLVAADGTIDRLVALGGGVTLGLCFGFAVDGANDYMAGAETTGDMPDLDTYTHPGGAFLVFPVRGSIAGGVLGRTWQRIYSEFLPQSQYRQNDLPTVERYLRWDVDKDHCDMEIWIPIEQ